MLVISIAQFQSPVFPTVQPQPILNVWYFNDGEAADGRALPDIMSGLEVQQIFKIQTV